MQNSGQETTADMRKQEAFARIEKQPGGELCQKSCSRSEVILLIHNPFNHSLQICFKQFLLLNRKLSSCSLTFLRRSFCFELSLMPKRKKQFNYRSSVIDSIILLYTNVTQLVAQGQMWPSRGCQVAPDQFLFHNENKLIHTGIFLFCECK